MIAEFLIYEGKVAVLMAVFYLFYRLLLSRETLHAVNRVVLIATVVSSFILPIIHLTRYRTVAYPDITLEAGEGAIDPTALTEMAVESPWILFLFGVFILGAFIIITRIAFAIVKVRRILSKGRPIILEDGTEITVIEEDIAPFSLLRSRDKVFCGERHYRGSTFRISEDKGFEIKVNVDQTVFLFKHSFKFICNHPSGKGFRQYAAKCIMEQDAFK